MAVPEVEVLGEVVKADAEEIRARAQILNFIFVDFLYYNTTNAMRRRKRNGTRSPPGS